MVRATLALLASRVMYSLQSERTIFVSSVPSIKTWHRKPRMFGNPFLQEFHRSPNKQQKYLHFELDTVRFRLDVDFTFSSSSLAEQQSWGLWGRGCLHLILALPLMTKNLPTASQQHTEITFDTISLQEGLKCVTFDRSTDTFQRVRNTYQPRAQIHPKWSTIFVFHSRPSDQP